MATPTKRPCVRQPARHRIAMQEVLERVVEKGSNEELDLSSQSDDSEDDQDSFFVFSDLCAAVGYVTRLSVAGLFHLSCLYTFLSHLVR